MTEAEERFLEACTGQYKLHAEYDGYSLGSPTLDKALREVLLERMPPEYEQSLKAAAYRAWDALEAMDKIRKQHAMGHEFVRRARAEWKTERGIVE